MIGAAEASGNGAANWRRFVTVRLRFPESRNSGCRAEGKFASGKGGENLKTDWAVTFPAAEFRMV